VAGDRQGVVMEDELEAGQRFSDDYERSKYEAEKLVRRWARRIPVTVFRPTLLGGDSTDGTLDPAGPAFRLFEMLISGGRDSLALSSTASDAPFNLVPIDFVVRAADQIARHKAAVGRTFHLVDPNPLSVRRLYTLVARKAHRQPPKRLLPPQLVEWLPKVPLLSRLQPHLPTPLSVFALHNVFFNSQNTADLLRDTDVHCPPLHAYIDLVVRHVREVIDQRRPAAEEEISDPLA
jgi:thioester reductase-like protein